MYLLLFFENNIHLNGDDETKIKGAKLEY